MSAIEELAIDRCWDLLRSVPVGRLAVVIGDRPEIFPVNHVVDRGTIVFRTAEGTKLVGSVRGAFVAYEIDGYDDSVGQAWSVVVKGRAVEIRQMRELLDTVDLPLAPWQADPKNHFVRIDPDEVTGRQFAVSDPSEWDNLLSRVRRSPLE